MIWSDEFRKNIRKKKKGRISKNLIKSPKAFDPIKLLYLNDTLGIEVREGGSGIAKWPNGKVAVSVEYDSVDGGYRIYAANDFGSPLISLNSDGSGFINYANGNTWISSTSKNGFIVDTHGCITTQWDADMISTAGTGIVAEPQLADPSKEMYLHFNDNLSAQVRLDNKRRLKVSVTFNHPVSPVENTEKISYTFNHAW